MKPTKPMPIEFFAGKRPPAGDRGMALELSGLRLEIVQLDEPLQAALLARYFPYSEDGTGRDGALRVRLSREARDYFIEPPERPEPNRILIACDGDRIRYTGYRVAGWFDTAALEGELLLAGGTYEPEVRAIENYVRASVAWLAAVRGGALVHAASAVWRGKGYLFFGESGAGKSTLAESNRRARIVSDDLSLLLPGEGGGLDLVGSPFRGTYEGGPPVQGRFPMAAGFRILKGERAEVRPATRVRNFAELVGNLPFVAEAYSRRPDLFRKAEDSFASLPLGHLYFRKDDSYWDAIERAGL